MRQIITLFVLLACGCGLADSNDKSREMRMLLEQRLAQSNPIFHTGCDLKGLCQDPKRRCVANAEPVLEFHSETGTVAIEWEPSPSERVETLYWFVDPDGGGTMFNFLAADIGDCGSWCGYHMEQALPGTIIGSEAALNIRYTGLNGYPIRDLGKCGAP